MMDPAGTTDIRGRVRNRFVVLLRPEESRGLAGRVQKLSDTRRNAALRPADPVDRLPSVTL